MPYNKLYKPVITDIFRMFPGDSTESPDDFFYVLTPQYDERNAEFSNKFIGGLYFF